MVARFVILFGRSPGNVAPVHLCWGMGVGRGKWRLHCWMCAPPRKIRRKFQERKHTSLTFLVVTFYELRRDGVLRSSPLGDNRKVARE
jgi:hypothetical protein